MDGEVQVFENETFGKIRVIVEGDEFSFVASDIARATGYHDAAHMVRYLNDDEKGYKTIATPGGEQRVLVINEPGLYHVLGMRQTVYVKDPEARAYLESFQYWAYHEVFPTIRAKGYYVNPAHDKTREEQLADAYLLALEVRKEREQRIQALEAENKAMQPKAAFADAVAGAKGGILIGMLAAYLNQNGVDIGRNRLFKRLRDEEYLHKRGRARNLPTQKSLDLGLMTVRECVIHTASGDKTRHTTLVTGKGQRYFFNKYAGEKRASYSLPPGEEVIE